MSWMSAIGECAVCKRMFSFNPELVPSVVVQGTKLPICRPCVERANPMRVERGLPEIKILPGAYEAQEVS